MSLLLTLAGGKTFGQAIEWPKNDMIFQRSNSNTATVKFVLKHSSNITSVALKFQKFNISTNGSSDQWSNYVDPETGNTDNSWKSYAITSGSGTCQVLFNANVKGGYYRVTAQFNGSAESSIINFGVGEVLAIAGQSNAGGYAKDGNLALSYNSTFVKFKNEKSRNIIPGTVNKLEGFDNGGIGNDGNGIGNDPGTKDAGPFEFAYYWGKLGEDLARNQQVPIAFYQAAFGGTSVEAWWSSIDNQTFGAYPNGFPYNNLKNILTKVRKQVGLRGVLWHQGERDAQGGMISDTYAAYLRWLTRKSRIDASDKSGNGQSPCTDCHELAWVVSKASRYGSGSVSTFILDAQQRVIGDGKTAFGDWSATVGDGTKYMYPGPSTDDVVGSDRVAVDGVHLTPSGQSQFKSKWLTALTTPYGGQTFFQSSNPIQNNQTVDVPLGCTAAGCNPSAPACSCGFDLLSVSITGQSGTFGFSACDAYGIDWKMKNASGAVVASGNVSPTSANVPFSIPSGIPTGTYTFETCVTKNTPAGSTTCNGFDSISFFYTGVGCSSPTPTITANGTTSLCAGSSVTLTASGCSGTTPIWSNGTTANSIVVSTAGNYSAKCSSQGCQSNSIGVTVTTCEPLSSCYRFYIAGFHSSNDFRPITLSGSILNLPSNGDNSNNSIWKKVQDGAYSKLVSVTNENTAITIESGSASFEAVVNVAAYTGAGSQKWSIEQSSGQPYYFIKSSLNTGLFIGGGNGSWDGGDTDPNSKDLKLKSDASWGGNKWYMQSVTCPTTCSSPTLTITANGSTSLCGGGLVSLSTSGCSGGTINWSNGGTGTGTTVSAAGSYTATCTLSGCTQSSPSNAITVTTCNPSPCYRFYIAGYHSSNDFRPITLSGSVLNIPSNGDNTNNSIWKKIEDGAYSKLVSVTNENTAITIEGGSASFDAIVNVASYTGAGSQKWQFEQASGQSYHFIKSSLNAGLFIGGGNGAWDGGDADPNTKDLKLKSDASWGGNKWYMQSVTCPNGRISAEYVASNVDEGSTKTVVSPNPTDGIIKVKYHLTGQATVFFSFTDNLGKTILTKQVESKAGSNQTEFDLKNNPAGIYYLNLRSVQKTETVKVVKVN